MMYVLLYDTSPAIFPHLIFGWMKIVEVDVPINGVSQLQVDPAERYFKYLPYGSLEYVRMYLHSYIAT